MASSTSRGLRILRSIELLQKRKPNIFDNVTLNKVKFTSISNGEIKGWFIVEPSMCNVGNLVHGGFMASVIDVVAYYAQMSNPGGRIAVTMNMSVTFIAAAKEGEKVTVETKCLRSGQASIIESYLLNEDGKLIAKGINSFMATLDKHQIFLKDIFDVYED